MISKNILSLTILLLGIVCITLPLSNAQQIPTLSITPNTTHLTAAQLGTNIQVDLIISNVQNLYAWNLNLTWNPSVLNLTDITEGPFLSSADHTLFTWTPSISANTRNQGYIQNVAASLLSGKGIDGNGVLATITFQVIDIGTSTLSIDGSELAPQITTDVSQRISATITNGLVVVDNQANNSPTPTTLTTQKTTPTIPEFLVVVVPLTLVLSTTVYFSLRKRWHAPALV